MKIDKTFNFKATNSYIKDYHQILLPEKSQFFAKNTKIIENVYTKKEFQEEILQQKEISDIIKEINKMLNFLSKGLKIEIDEELKIPIFKIIDLETQEVLRQIPWEEILRLRKFLKDLSEKELKNKEFLKGLLLKKEV